MGEAAGVGTTLPLDPQEPQNNTSPCMNPLVEDPESWDCDCYEVMHTRCDDISSLPVVQPVYSLSDCLRALLCHHDGVCGFWKDEFCSSVSPILHDALFSNSSSLA